jgi:mRNA-degrading endonuclease toxin of MazEF toxin-antitoxin module
MNYNKRDIVVVKFPFILREKGEIQKGRPAMVLSDDKMERRYKDIILAAITSNIPQDIYVVDFMKEKDGYEDHWSDQERG